MMKLAIRPLQDPAALRFLFPAIRIGLDHPVYSTHIYSPLNYPADGVVLWLRPEDTAVDIGQPANFLLFTQQLGLLVGSKLKRLTKLLAPPLLDSDGAVVEPAGYLYAHPSLVAFCRSVAELRLSNRVFLPADAETRRVLGILELPLAERVAAIDSYGAGRFLQDCLFLLRDYYTAGAVMSRAMRRRLAGLLSSFSGTAFKRGFGFTGNSRYDAWHIASYF